MYENEYGLDRMEPETGADAEISAEEETGLYFAGGDEEIEDMVEEGDAENEQDETEAQAPPEKPKRARRRKKEEPEQPEPVFDGENPEESGIGEDVREDEGLSETESGDAGEDEPADDVPVPDHSARRVRSSRRESMLDEYGRVVSERRWAVSDGLNTLSAAGNRRMILTGTVDGIENDGNALPRVVFYVGGVKVLIPFSEMGFDLNSEEVDAGEAGRRMDAMLGAKIDYMVRRVDTRNRIAAASRRDAMLMRQRTILNARSGESYRIREGMKCTARVIRVSRHVMLVEVYGFQTYIRRDAVSSLWVNDIRETVRAGEERPVRILRLERDAETGEVIRMEVSMKEAEAAAETELRAGNAYTGTISGFSETAYFVKVLGVPVEVRCSIRSNHILETMDMGDTVKVVVRGISDRGGYIASVRKLLRKAETSLL